MKPGSNPLRSFNASTEIIRPVLMMYVRFPLSLRNGEDLLFARGIDICHGPKASAAGRCGTGQRFPVVMDA